MMASALATRRQSIVRYHRSDEILNLGTLLPRPLCGPGLTSLRERGAPGRENRGIRDATPLTRGSRSGSRPLHRLRYPALERRQLPTTGGGGAGRARFEPGQLPLQIAVLAYQRVNRRAQLLERARTRAGG